MTTKEAIKCLVDQMNFDPDYKRSWISNIAMAFKDRIEQYKKENNKTYLDKVDFHIIANEAAEAFLDNLAR